MTFTGRIVNVGTSNLVESTLLQLWTAETISKTDKPTTIDLSQPQHSWNSSYGVNS